MTQTSAGSYAFGQFGDNQQELDRLKAQAATARALERRILERSGLRPGMRVLDLGCGPGLISCELARMAAPGQVTGVDLSPELLAEATRSAAVAGLDNLGFQQGDVYDLRLEDEAFDFVYARFLFQHLARPEQVLGQALRVLRPGGIMAVVDVDDGWLALYPEPATFASFTSRAARTQATLGGDRRIGRKLGTYLAAAGFDRIKVAVETLTSGDLGMRAFLDLTTGYKYQQLTGADREQGARERDELYRLVDQPEAWGFTGIFVASGRRPDAS